jgi:hypothetical protein
VIYSPLEGYQFDEGKPVPIKAEVLGDGHVQSMEFLASGEVVGRDTEESDGWAVTWENPDRGRHQLQAVAKTQSEEAVSSRPMSCTNQSPTIWIGENEGILKGNAPNPFRSQTKIRYTLSRTEHVQVAVYDVLGRRVRVLVDRVQRAGTRKVPFNGNRLGSGTYFYRISTDSFQKWGKLTLVR